MEYRIIEEDPQIGLNKIIGEGFLSVNALWLAVHAEILRRLANAPIKANLRLERVENGTVLFIGIILLNDYRISS